MRLLLCAALSACLLACSDAPPEPRPSASEGDATPPEVAELDIATLQARMADGGLTSHALTQAYLDRIAAIDDAGPTLNAVIETNPDALDEAATLDAERRAGRVRGPLHGIPVLLKDNIDATPMVNSAGSLALAGHRPKTDAPLVRALREAGAVILGKTNLSEWANFRSTRSSSGWSARGGQTRNPYVLDRSPCGSSSGTGAAIAASLAAAGVGTETDGSVICPAAMTGLVGIKPTVGLVGRSGIIPIAQSQDTAGPMARSVADAALLLGVMASASNPADPATEAAAPHRLADYTEALDPASLDGARIGVLRDAMGRNPELDAAMERAIAAMTAAGATVVDSKIPTAGNWGDAEYSVLLYEFKDGLNRYLRDSGAAVGSLAELIEFNKANADREMPWFGQEILLQAQEKGSLDEADYLEAASKAKRLAGPEGIDAALEHDDLDALIAPATGPAWVTDLVNGDHFGGAGYGAAAVAGYPSVTVPIGNVHGLPVGAILMGPEWSEAELIGLAYALEQATQARTPPRFLPTLSPWASSD
ncbi:amidase [Lysobacter sp. F6437]|uniref:amidase n=1 Tax=Lysobacter sp. F6437 TaxID=3459296 RepID=UPI00403D97D1